MNELNNTQCEIVSGGLRIVDVPSPIPCPFSRQESLENALAEIKRVAGY